MQDDAAAIEVMARGICSTYRTGQCVKDDVDAVECSPCTAENCMPTRHATAALTALRKAGWSVTAPDTGQDWHDRVDPTVCHCGRDAECHWKYCPAKDGKCPLPWMYHDEPRDA